MSKNIIVVNAGPRKGWNTDTLITEAAKGAESAGAVITRITAKQTGNGPCFIRRQKSSVMKPFFRVNV